MYRTATTKSCRLMTATTMRLVRWFHPHHRPLPRSAHRVQTAAASSIPQRCGFSPSPCRSPSSSGTSISGRIPPFLSVHQQRISSVSSLALRGFHSGRIVLDNEEKPNVDKQAESASKEALEDSKKKPESSNQKPKSSADSTETPDEAPVQYSNPELTADAAKHKAGLADETRPFYQNPLHHNNPDMQKFFREDFDSDEAFEAAIQPLPPMTLDDGKVQAPEYLHEIADEVVHLTLLEMNELINKMAEHYGFHEGMMAPDDEEEDGAEEDEDAQAAPAAEARTVFDVKLVSFDTKSKIKIIKEVRSLASLGLKEAKDMVEAAPKVILKDVKQEDADTIVKKMEELGAVMEII